MSTRKRKGERPDGNIQSSCTVHGKRKYFYGKTRDEAKLKAESYKSQAESGLQVDKLSLTLSAWIATWKISYQIKEDYVSYIKKIETLLGHRKLRTITESELQATLNDYEGKSSSSAIKYRMILQRIFSKAYKNRIIPYDPSTDLQLPDTTSGSHRALERWEVDLILLYWHVYYSGFWAMLMLLCGLRRSEMMALDWMYIDMEARTITVCAAAVIKKGKTVFKDTTKTAAGKRILPICPPLYDMLNTVPHEQRTGLVCKQKIGKHITQGGIEWGWKTFCAALTRISNGEEPLQQGKRTDLNNPLPTKKETLTFNCTPQDLRHTYATMLYDAGVDVKSAQYYLGHASLDMTLALYTHLSEERKNKSRTSLNTYLDTWFKSTPSIPQIHTTLLPQASEFSVY